MPSASPLVDLVALIARSLVDQPDRGVVGLGEPPTISTAAAVANAVANAIGVRIRTLPISPQTILSALEQERAGGTL